MFTDSQELIKYRQELIQGGFTSDEAFELVHAYYDAKLELRQTEGYVFLTNEQVDLDGPADG